MRFKIILFQILFIYGASLNLFSMETYDFPPDSLKPDTTKPQIIIYQYDTLVVQDTVIYYDTVYYENNLKYSTEIYVSPFLVNSIESILDQQNDSYMQLREDSEQYRLSYLFGFAGIIHLKKFSTSLGLSYSTIRKKAEYNLVNIKLTDISYYNYIDNSYWSSNVVDSFYQVNFPDTNWIVVVDSIYNPVTDSILVNKYDSSITSQVYNDFNKYKYLEIPLILGYTISDIGKFSFDIKAGLIAGFLISTKGKTVLHSNDEEIVELSSPPLIKSSFHLYLSTRIDYHINSNYRLFVEPYYKKALKSIYEKSYMLNEKQDFVGFRMGFEYFF